MKAGTPVAGEEDRTRDRQAVRQLASGVSVLTVQQGGQIHGTTASAVTAVSREPLLIGVCLHRDSFFAQLCVARGWFAVNVLNTRQAPLAGWFADPQRPPGLPQFAALRWMPDPRAAAPLISGSLAALCCRVTACVPAGDHDLLLAEVVSGAVGEGSPLLSYAGELHDALLHSLPGRSAHPAARQPVPTGPARH